ncbi:MAG: M13 family metallopeptidase [Proteobacteria bacterium]|nr:M13 family metallopeptidase [Pseudomonadota bacterium]
MKSKILNIAGVIAVLVVALAVAYLKKDNHMGVGINLENMDLTVRPGDDFYDFATAGWQRANPLTGEYSRFGAFDKLREENLKQIRELVEGLAANPHAAGTVAQKIGDLYKVAMDADRLNADGIRPVGPDLAAIDAIGDKSELPAFMGRAVHPFTASFWADGVAPDMKDSSTNIFSIGQDGVGLPEREYYFDTDKKSEEIRQKYKKYMADAFAMFGMDPAEAKRVYAIEERMAKSFYKKEKLRLPEENYHKQSYAEFVKSFAGFDWDKYFAARGVHPQNIDVGQPEPFAESLAILSDAPLADIKLYLKWQMINDAMGFLNDAAYDLSFEFYGKTLSGKTDQRPRWKRGIGTLNGTLGEAVGQMYVEKYFPPAAKERMVVLVENLRAAYGQRIRALPWMSDETKKRATEKLGAFRAKIGYPDKFRDYSKLEISANDSYWENIKRADKFEDEYQLAKADKPVDRNEWLMNPHEVNAYYSPLTNEICFPAGILQYPFFDMRADDAFNYGAIGAVISHEMTHGFDDQGRKFDKDGNMNDWWTAADSAAFDKRAKVLKEFFNNIEVAPGTNANGEFTIGENLADYGGVTISFTAFQNTNPGDEIKDGFTPAQRFFIAYAGTEAGNIRPEEVLLLTKTDVHSLGRWRVNGILPHVDAWSDTFNVTPADKLYVAPEKRVAIW